MTGAGNEVDHTIWKTCSNRCFHQDAQIERCFTCRFNHDGAASNECRSQLDHDQSNGVVPRSNKCRNATGVAVNLRVVSWTVRVRAGVCLIDKVTQTCVVAKESSTVTSCQAGLRNGSSIFTGDDLCKRLCASFELVSELAHVVSTLVGADIAPSLTSECSRCRSNCLVDVGFVCCGNLCPDFFRRRVGHINEDTGTRLDPLATIKQVVGVHL